MPTIWMLLVLLSTLLVPATAAQDDPFVLILEDAAGDAVVTANGSDGAAMETTPAGKDLASLHLHEQKDSMTFRVQYHPQDAVGEQPTNDLQVGFRHGDQRYVLDLSDPNQEGIAELYRVDGAGNPVRVATCDLAEKDSNLVLEALVPRAYLIDEDGATPRPGTALVDFWVASRAPIIPLSQDEADVSYTDLMPDAGVSATGYEFQMGQVSTGSARVFSPAPARSSNGEAGVFLYQVVAVNEGASRETFLLRVADKPDPFQVTVTEPRIELEPGASRAVAVVVSTPFQHQHGKYESFNITMESAADDGSRSTVELGIRYHEVPQPAGHHDTLWLHAAGDSSEVSPVLGSPSAHVFMNAMEQDPNDDGVPIKAYDVFVTRDSFLWRIELSPSLDIGLDFDLDRTAYLEVPVSSELPLTGTRVSADLYRERPGSGQVQRLLLASAREEAATDMAAGETRLVMLDMVAEKAADHVPFAPESQLVLDLRMDIAAPMPRSEASTPAVEPGGVLRLPLNEFLDEVDEEFLAPGAFEVVASRVQALANPGKTVVYEIELRNTFGEAQRIGLELEGLNTEWARVNGPATIDLAADEPRTLQLVVTVPDDARDRDVADVVLVATSRETGERSLTRFLTVVDLDAEHPDEASLAASIEGNDSPGPGVALLALALAAVAVALRRR